MVWIVDNVVSLAQEFVGVALADPISAVLLALGALVTAYAALGFGALSIWAVVDWLTPEGRSPPTYEG